jgi:predicted permease
LIPLMLMALGNTIGSLKTHNLPRARLRPGALAISFVVAVSVSFALGLSGVAQGVLVLQGAMPAAVFSYLFAAHYERDADDVAGHRARVDAGRRAPLAVPRVVRAVARALSCANTPEV